MPLSDVDFQAWLESDTALRCTLVEVGVNINGIEQTLYLSNRSYNTSASEEPSNTSYLPVIRTSLDFTEDLPLTGNASLSYGDIAIENFDGSLDDWINYVWVGRSIKVFIGDLTGPRDNFNQIYTGVVADIAFSDKSTINISIRSLLEKLNVPITSTLIGGTGPNATQLRPLLFGECFNITPVSIDPANLTYMIHDGPIERIIEIRDNGVPLILDDGSGTGGYTEDLTTGVFSLLHPPVGTITCSAQGYQRSILIDPPILTDNYYPSIATIIGVILAEFGINFISISEDFDAPGFYLFELSNSYPVGIYITQSTNIITICQQLAASVGAVFTSTREGKLTIIKIVEPIFDELNTIVDENGIVDGSLSITTKVPVVGSINLAYCKNWTIQNQLQTGILQEHKNLYISPFLYSIVSDTDVSTLYKVTEAAAPKETLLLNSYSVGNEATRLLHFYKVPRYIFNFECTAAFLQIKLGQMVTLRHRRFGLSLGKPGQIVHIETNWNNGGIKLGILI